MKEILSKVARMNIEDTEKYILRIANKINPNIEWSCKGKTALKFIQETSKHPEEYNDFIGPNMEYMIYTVTGKIGEWERTIDLKDYAVYSDNLEPLLQYASNYLEAGRKFK